MVLVFVTILLFTVIFVTEQTKKNVLFIFKSFLGLFDIYSAKINSPPL